MRPLVGEVVKQAGEWVNLLGRGLLLEARNRLNHVLQQVTVGPYTGRLHQAFKETGYGMV